MQAPQGSSSIFSSIMIGLMFVVFYFFIIRPNSKKQKEQEKFIVDIKVGDKIVTIAGIHGKVVALNEADNTLSIQVDSTTKIKIERSAVSLEMSKKAQQNSAS